MIEIFMECRIPVWETEEKTMNHWQILYLYQQEKYRQLSCTIIDDSLWERWTNIKKKVLFLKNVVKKKFYGSFNSSWRRY